MVILLCIVNGILPAVLLKKEKSVCLTNTLINIFFSVTIYAYYIGYSYKTFEAAFCQLTPNTLYFAAISVAVAVAVFGYLFWQERTGGWSVQLQYDLSRADKILLAISIFAAFLVRVIGFWSGNGVTFHPDEGNMVNDPQNMAAANTLMSDAVFYPAQISHKILSLLFKAYTLICDVFQMEYHNVYCHYIARIYIALLSVGIVVCIFYIGNYFVRHAGTVACMMASVFPVFVQTAHCITGDTVTAFIGCLAMLAALKYFAAQKKAEYLLIMSFLAAAATLEKWNGMVICGMIAFVVIVENSRNGSVQFMRILKEGVLAIGGVLLSMVLISPNLIGRIPELIASVFKVVGGYEGDNSFLDNVYEYMMEFFSHAGILCLPFMIAGGWALFRIKRAEISALSLGLLTMVGMCAQNRAFVRWAYLFYICFVILIGAGVVALWNSRWVKKTKGYQFLYALILFLIGLNQISETILLDIVYTNSQRDTRLVSEQWCLEQGIAIEDCIYDRFTCWAPGGVSRYPVEWHKMGVSRYITQEEDGSILVERLGRSYAIDVDYNYRYAENELAALDLPVVAVFESDWRTDGGSLYDCYHAFSPKIFEPYSIGDSIKKSVDILQGNMNIGRSIYIYDIRAFPAREIFLADDFEEVVTDEGQSVLRADIISILKGNYSIKVLGSPDLEGTISFEDQQGNVISKALLKNQQATIQLAESYTYIVCEVALNNVNDFEKVIISTIN